MKEKQLTLKSKELEARKNVKALRQSELIWKDRRDCEVKVIPDGETIAVRVRLYHHNKMVDCRELVADFSGQVDIAQAIDFALDFYELGRSEAEWLKCCNEFRKNSREDDNGL
jgi:hypothetical protein